MLYVAGISFGEQGRKTYSESCKRESNIIGIGFYSYGNLIVSELFDDKDFCIELLDTDTMRLEKLHFFQLQAMISRDRSIFDRVILHNPDIYSFLRFNSKGSAIFGLEVPLRANVYNIISDCGKYVAIVTSERISNVIDLYDLTYLDYYDWEPLKEDLHYYVRVDIYARGFESPIASYSSQKLVEFEPFVGIVSLKSFNAISIGNFLGFNLVYSNGKEIELRTIVHNVFASSLESYPVVKTSESYDKWISRANLEDETLAYKSKFILEG